MNFTDLQAELPDLDGAPSGEDLEFDRAFGELERAALAKPEQQYGDTIIPAEPPNWKDVTAQATALLERTRDLRILVPLAVARLNLGGIVEFVSVLSMLRHQVEQRWEDVHPKLDPEDDNDPTLRANALLRLTDPVLVIRTLRNLPLAGSRRDGPVSWRSIGIATGQIEPGEDGERKSDQVIRAAFHETGAEALTARREAIETGIRAVAAISAAFDTHSGYGNGPDLGSLTKQFQEMARYIGQYMPAGDGAPLADMAEDMATEEGSPAGQQGGARGGMSIASLSSVNSRADALRLLDLVCRYYEEHEPSSPLPLMIGRARALADKSFLEIMQDLAPDGLQQAQAVVQSRDTGG